MTKEQVRTLLHIILSIIAICILIGLLSIVSPFFRNWGIDFIDPILVYFLVLSIRERRRLSLPPRLPLAVLSIGLGWYFELLQLWRTTIWPLPKGVFDPIDLAMFVAGGCVAVAMDTVLIRRK